MYEIVSDGSCDLPTRIIEEYSIHVVPFYVSTDGETYKKEKEELKVDDLYQFMIAHKDIFPKTSLPSVQDYINMFTPMVEDGKDIICICITTKFSGSYNSAIGARDILLEKYPSANITIIDAMVNTVLQGLLVIEAGKMRQNKLSYDETVSEIERLKYTGRIFFTVGSMDYLVHGGRVGKLSGIAAGTLGIKPLIVLEDGEIQKGGIARGRNISKKKVINMVLQYLKENEIDPTTYTFTIGYGYDKAEGITFKDQFLVALKEIYPTFKEEVSVYHIGATIAVHTGPYPIGIGLLEKGR